MYQLCGNKFASDLHGPNGFQRHRRTWERTWLGDASQALAHQGAQSRCCGNEKQQTVSASLGDGSTRTNIDIAATTKRT